MSEPTQPAGPGRLEISRLEVRGYRSLRSVRWPEDGLGWKGRVPQMVLVGGVNGSGKTTLLEVLFGLVGFLVGRREHEDVDRQALRWLPRGAESIVLELDTGDDTPFEVTVTSNERGIISEPAGPRCAGIWVSPDEDDSSGIRPRDVLDEYRRALAKLCVAANGPSLLYFPTDRSVPIPATRFKRAGLDEGPRESPFYRYQVPDEWERSVEAVLYDARWRDLNAKEQGSPEEATHFVAYEQALEQFFGGTKRFVWDRNGVLHVETKHGDRHPLDALSSGEKQILLFVAELFRRWTPGSLVLIDEPELHLHESWLASLWSALRRLQRERGGQVIVTTQSNYLFGLGEPGSRVLLGGGLG